ncbi:MAG TPA: hypothetical protein PLG45_00310 [Candidatus Paceibacterota bacterium]|jgi:hypothetical protein|nr:hypothetical protein [Candidatus Paceibacterota bacterium]HPI66583.1 hypothetical protein [Candidatus Paceibacterota bacterium]HPK14192.1 hypothetical protein [Candidatus Paceibacterota bacterium]HQC46234.1 hypothetical protein [Candidatus Paceibacterota bacterium]
MKKNPCVCISWHDASYSDSKNATKKVPPVRLTCGFVIEENKNFVNLAVNCYYTDKNKKLEPIDGFLIPTNTIVSFKKIGFYNEK